MSKILILSTTALKSSLDELAPSIVLRTGCELSFSFRPSARIASDLDGGAQADVIVTVLERLNDLVEKGRVVLGSCAPLVRSGMALAVQQGAPRPDISSSDAFVAAMLATKSLGMSNPVGGGQSGSILVEAFTQLGIAEVMKSKSIYGAGGPEGLIGKMLLRGEVETGIQQLPELMAVPGIDIVGPLPSPIQRVTVFAAGVSSNARNVDGAQAMIASLKSQAANEVYQAKGFDLA